MKNLKQNNKKDCVLYAISNLFQEDIVDKMKQLYKPPYNADTLRFIIENENANDLTIVNNYNTSESKKPIRLKYDSILCEIDKDAEDHFYYLGFIGTVCKKDSLNNHMTAIAVNASNGKVIHFDSMKDDFVIYKNGVDFLKNIQVHRLDWICEKKTYHKGIPSVFCEWLAV